jgi:hypothetical protein
MQLTSYSALLIRIPDLPLLETLQIVLIFLMGLLKQTKRNHDKFSRQTGEPGVVLSTAGIGEKEEEKEMVLGRWLEPPGSVQEHPTNESCTGWSSTHWKALVKEPVQLHPAPGITSLSLSSVALRLHPFSFESVRNLPLIDVLCLREQEVRGEKLNVGRGSCLLLQQNV